MKQNKKIPLRFSKKKDWLAFSGSPLSVSRLANPLKRKISSLDFDFMNDLGIIKLGKRKGAREATLFFKTEPIIGLLVWNRKKKEGEEFIEPLLMTLDALHRFSRGSRAGKTIAPTLFKALEKLIKKKSFKDIRLLKVFVRKLRKCSADELWDLAIFAGFPEDIFDFAKFIEKKEGKKINLAKNIRDWYETTDAGRERVMLEEGLRKRYL